MAQVTVTIAGHVYRVACGEGEEAHLQGLARQIDERLEVAQTQLRRNRRPAADDYGGDHHRRRAGRSQSAHCQLEVEIVNLKSDKTTLESEQDEWADRLADLIGETATRIERAAQNLNGISRG